MAFEFHGAFLLFLQSFKKSFRDRLALENLELMYIKKQNFSKDQKPFAEHDFGTIKKTDPLTAIFQKFRFPETLPVSRASQCTLPSPTSLHYDVLGCNRMCYREPYLL